MDMKKKILYTIRGLYRDDFRVTGYEFGKGEKSLCIVGAARGNEIQQLYVCSQIVKKFRQLEEEGRICDGHSILVIPSVNPYSINIRKRFWPTDNTDINRMFPGYDLGETTQRIADGVFKVVSEYKIGIQFASFYNAGNFLPHIKIMKAGYSSVEMAKQFGMPYVIMRNVRPYDTTTLNYNWQVWETQAFSFYTTTTTSIDRTSAGQAVLSILSFLSRQGIVKYHGPSGRLSKVVDDSEFIAVQTAKSGIFEPLVSVGTILRTGAPLANIIHPYEGEIIETLYAPCDGVLFFMHNEPLTYASTAVFKLIPEGVG